MNDIRTIHNEAMDLALKGDNATRAEAQSLYSRAFEKEREAALLADSMQNPEPGPSILFRSAASLAIQCGRLREGEQLIARALSGSPTESAVMELRQMLHDIYEATEKATPNHIIYKLEVPDTDSKDVESYLGKLGLKYSRIPANERFIAQL